MTNTCLLWQNMSFVATKVCLFLLWQKYFVMTNIILSWQAYFFHDKTHLLLWQMYACRDKSFVGTKLCWDKYLSWQRHITFVTTEMILVAAPANDSTVWKQHQFRFLTLDCSYMFINLDWNAPAETSIASKFSCCIKNKQQDVSFVNTPNPTLKWPQKRKNCAEHM